MMEVIKIRRDRLDTTNHHNCEHCNKRPKENDVIISTEINYEFLTFCSEECILEYLKELGDMNNIFVRKAIEVYDLTPTQELNKRIDDMKPNTRLELDDGLSIEYFETPGMRRHYLLNSSVTSRLFRSSYELAQYINRNEEN